MAKLIIKETRAYLGVLLGVIFLLTVTSPRADDEKRDELHSCGLIEDSAARLACYDTLSGRRQPGLTAPDNIIESTTNGSLDELGSDSIHQEKGSAPVVRATVTRCRKDENGMYRFYFENGQVWRQTDRKRLKYKECEFDITITEDFFGHKMRPDGGKSRIRIKRLK